VQVVAGKAVAAEMDRSGGDVREVVAVDGMVVELDPVEATAVEVIAVEVAGSSGGDSCGGCSCGCHSSSAGKWLLQKSNNKPAAIDAGRMDHSFVGQWWQHEQLLLLHRSSRLQPMRKGENMKIEKATINQEKAQQVRATLHSAVTATAKALWLLNTSTTSKLQY